MKKHRDRNFFLKNEKSKIIVNKYIICKIGTFIVKEYKNIKNTIQFFFYKGNLNNIFITFLNIHLVI